MNIRESEQDDGEHFEGKVRDDHGRLQVGQRRGDGDEEQDEGEGVDGLIAVQSPRKVL